MVSIAVIKHPNPRQTGKESVYLAYRMHFIVRRSQCRKRRQELQQRSGDCFLVASPLASLSFLLLYTTQDRLPRRDITHSELVLPTSIINQENTPADMSSGQSDGGIFLIKLPSSHMAPDCVKLKTKRKIKAKSN